MISQPSGTNVQNYLEISGMLDSRSWLETHMIINIKDESDHEILSENIYKVWDLI